MGITRYNGYHRKKRNSNSRNRKSVILISAEGNNKTETNYFRFWRNKGYIIEFVSDNHTDPVKMLIALQKEFNRKELSIEYGDMAFCLIDHDCSKEKDAAILKADSLAEKMGFNILISNPCFEIWFLCHYTFSTKQFSSSKDVIKDLVGYFPKYDKASKDVACHLSSLTTEGIKNAKKLDEFCADLGKKKHHYDYQPSTEVYKLVELLLGKTKE